MPTDDIDPNTLPPLVRALDDLLPILCYEHPPGAKIMLYLIAYDIADPKRWRRVCDKCEDHGARVQYSLFECWLEEEAFANLWEDLQKVIDAAEDRLVAYTLDATAARNRRAKDRLVCGLIPR